MVGGGRGGFPTSSKAGPGRAPSGSPALAMLRDRRFHPARGFSSRITKGKSRNSLKHGGGFPAPLFAAIVPRRGFSNGAVNGYINPVLIKRAFCRFGLYWSCKLCNSNRKNSGSHWWKSSRWNDSDELSIWKVRAACGAMGLSTANGRS
jgi:hypothetical protein